MKHHIIYKAVAATLLCTPLLLASCQRETKDEKIRRDFRNLTEKECPKDVDPYTSMDSVVYDIPTRTLSYYYSVREMLDDESLYTEEVVNLHREKVQKDLKSSIQMKSYKDQGITFRYEYRSVTSGKVLLDLSFTKEDY